MHSATELNVFVFFRFLTEVYTVEVKIYITLMFLARVIEKVKTDLENLNNYKPN